LGQVQKIAQFYRGGEETPRYSTHYAEDIVDLENRVDSIGPKTVPGPHAVGTLDIGQGRISQAIFEVPQAIRQAISQEINSLVERANVKFIIFDTKR